MRAPRTRESMRIDLCGAHCRREKTAQYERLSVVEKVLLSTSRMFFRSRGARLFISFYAVALHFLVFATMWHFTHVSHGEHAGASVATGGAAPGLDGSDALRPQLVITQS